MYHYGVYEISALKRLAGRSGLREKEVDQFLRQKVQEATLSVALLILLGRSERRYLFFLKTFIFF